MLQSKILTKPFCFTLLGIAFVYGLVLPFCWGNNPSDELGTLSLLCEDRKIWFWIWGLLMSGSVVCNVQYMYKKYEYKNKFFDALCVLSLISVVCIALTLGHSIADWNPKRILHWIATGVFIVVTLASIVLFFLVNIKKHRHFPIYFACSVLIILTFALIFGLVGKSALMEMIPMAMMQILLFAVNSKKNL